MIYGRYLFFVLSDNMVTISIFCYKKMLQKIYKIQKKIRLLKTKEEIFEELGKPQAIGPDTNKMIVYPQPFIPIDYNFPFGKVHSKGIGFIENEIDCFPRKRDEVIDKNCINT